MRAEAQTRTVMETLKDKTLFTPGPLTTSQTVKQAMLRDVGSRDDECIDVIQEIRDELLELGGVANSGYTAILLQGSGTFGIEAVLASVTPPHGKWLVVINGAYGRRIAHIADVLKLDIVQLAYSEHTPPDPVEIAGILAADTTITHVAVVHCETTTGIINPIEEIGAVTQQAGRHLLVDAMSSFGAVPLNMAESHIDYLVSSANKCIEGVPGFSFVLAHRAALVATEGFARSVCLDLLAQLKGFEANGQFRFTPPTHALIAFAQALRELQAEGGVAGRGARYQRNQRVLLAGMRAMGFREYLQSEDQSYIITAFHYPDHPNFDFHDFYQRLRARDCVIYPGKGSDVDCFRIGHIGHIFESDMCMLLDAIRETLTEMEIPVL
jgi:2-aminoethylphosphonate-pyruvate transaminase